VYSKADLIPADERYRLEHEARSTTFSAVDKASAQALLGRLAEILPGTSRRAPEPEAVAEAT